MDGIKRINRRNLGLLTAGILFFGFSIFLEGISFSGITRKAAVRRFEKVLQEKELSLYGLFDQVEAITDTTATGNFFSTLNSGLLQEAEDLEIELFIFKADTLEFWTGNSVNPDPLFGQESREKGLVLLGNGWFVKKERLAGKRRIVGLILVKNEYPYQNRFLQNHFQEDFRLPSGTRIDTTGGNPANRIHDSWNRVLFSLDFSKVFPYSPLQSHVSLVFFFLGLLFFLLYLRHLIKSISDPGWKNAGIGIGAVILILVNALLIRISLPAHIRDMQIFSPQLYAVSELFPSLAHLLITSSFLFFLAYIFYAESRIQRKRSKVFRKICQVGFFIFLAGYYQLIIIVFRSLVMNSSITFEAYRVLETSIFTYIGLLILAFHFIALSILMDKYFSLFLPYPDGRSLALHLLIAGILAASGGFLIPEGPDFMVVLIFMLVLGLVGMFRWKHQIPYRYSSFVLMILLYSIFTVYKILDWGAEKRRNEKMVLAVDLSAEHDPVAELLLNDLEEKIANDRELEYLIVDGYIDELVIEDYLLRTYFNGYWEKYDLQFTLCGPQDSLYIEPREEVWYHCYDFFDSLRVQKGIKIPGSRFYFIDNMNGRISYFASFDYFSADSSAIVTLFLELDSRLVTEQLGYPELLLSERPRKGYLQGDYTYAKYSNGTLITQTGDYSYSLSSRSYSTGRKEFEFSRSNGYNHLAYNVDPSNTIVVSNPRTSLLNMIISFTYIFVFYYLLVTVNLLFVNMPFMKRSFQLNIKNKIQYTMIGLLVLSLLLIGGGTIFFSIRQYRARHFDNLSEKIQSVYIEVMHKLEFERTLNRDWQGAGYANLDELLKKFSNVFYSDINLYDPGGLILATSRSEIFENNLMGPRMHPAAFRELFIRKAAEFVHEEQIGSLEYLSAYVPFRNIDNKLLAYLNLPYFTKQKELTREVSNLVVAVVNFYVLLITIAVLIAIFISAQITQPLRMLQSKFGKISLGKTNEKIAYEAEDEIGSLVREYNHMIDELADSAERLARSERESAWREMAKQIAHEIKNPLTPMKLSVQHLQKIFRDDSLEPKKNLQRITYTLIEQIDHLSAIATEFSNFAQMPRARNEKVDLKDKINKISELFLNTEQIRIETTFLNTEPAVVFADREQLSRVFINLIKNAIQSVPEDRKGKIGVQLETGSGNAIVKVMDNGRGIPEDLGDRLFQPNFTTKSSGMGMGLAIVKSIIEQSGGSIRYETEVDKGTTFIVQLPLYGHQALPD